MDVLFAARRSLEARILGRLDEIQAEHFAGFEKADDPTAEEITAHYHALAETVLKSYAEFEARLAILQAATNALSMDTQQNPAESEAARERMYEETEDAITLVRRYVVCYTSIASSMRLEEAKP